MAWQNSRRAAAAESAGIQDTVMTFTHPAPNQAFAVSAAPAWPTVVFETDGKGPHDWQWTLSWDTFSRSGTATTPGNIWDASTVIVDGGGALVVTATAAQATSRITVRIAGANPTAAELLQYLQSKPGGEGFARILQHETRSRHFTDAAEPMKSFDNGYGMCQLTRPEPTFEQVWNWKRNVDGGLALFAQKRAAAMSYLGQAGRSYTASQLEYETISRWNGGAYHRWDQAAARWVRTPTILCDRATGNIGWDMTDPANVGKTEAQLRARDRGSYAKRPTGAHWRYFGVCYADRILG
jgi:hypothetical protein